MSDIKGLLNIVSFAKKAVRNMPRAKRAVSFAMITNTVKKMKTNKVLGPPLSKATIKRKKNNIKLVDTGRLSSAGAFTTRFYPQGIVVISEPRYGIFHQKGKGVPKRVFLFFTVTELKQYGTIFLKALVR